MAIVKVLRPRKNYSGKTRHRSSQAATRAGEYYTWGREYQREYGDGLERGTWYGPAGKQTWEQVQTWAQAESMVHPYTFKLVLSCKGGVPMDGKAWQQIMASQREFADWRVIGHADTGYRHAHVLLFGDQVYGQAHDKILATKAFREWFAGLRGEISRRELEYKRQMQAEIAQRRPECQRSRERQAQMEMA